MSFLKISWNPKYNVILHSRSKKVDKSSTQNNKKKKLFNVAVYLCNCVCCLIDNLIESVLSFVSTSSLDLRTRWQLQRTWWPSNDFLQSYLGTFSIKMHLKTVKLQSVNSFRIFDATNESIKHYITYCINIF